MCTYKKYIIYVDTRYYLGDCIDNKLNFKYHINVIITR